MQRESSRERDEFDSWEDPWASTAQHRQAEPAEEFELHEDHELLNSQAESSASSTRDSKYADGTTIDWIREEAGERLRQQHIHTLHDFRRWLTPLLEGLRVWAVVISSGVCVGVVGAWLDILSRWFSDLRDGRCSLGFFYNRVSCCSGFDDGEVCTDWLTWSQYLGVNFIFVQSLLQAFIYILLAIAFSSSSCFLVKTYAPYAFHTGIPEIKAIIGGYVFDEFLGAWTLLIKSVGLVLAVASGLSLGKEGPLVHVSCCMAFLMSKIFRRHIRNEATKRRLLASAAVAGISVAFGSPLGGVLFGLEELDTFANDSDVIWRGFVTSVIAAVSLQYVNPFGTSKLVLFEVKSGSDTWRVFELLPWLFLSVVGGVLGSFLIRLNIAAAVYRQHSALRQHPLLEVVGATAVTACISFLIVFLREQTSELVANLFQECDLSKGDYHGLCNPNALMENVFLLLLTAAIKIGLTAWTFGMMIPAGVILPVISIGACIGRAVGLIVQGLHRSYPELWIFSACPPDPSAQCVTPGFYAVIGASAMLGGVTRMTISLVAIMFELTGALSHVLPIMISVMVSKWVADAWGKEGIYSRWIALHNYPWLPTAEYRDKGEAAAHMMIPFDKLVTIDADTASTEDLGRLVDGLDYHGFPVVKSDRQLQGYVMKDRLAAALASSNSSAPRLISFDRHTTSGSSRLDLSDLLEESVIQLRREVPQELVVKMFQKMNLRNIFITRLGKLEGLITRSDAISLLTSDAPFVGYLSHESPADVEPSLIWETR